MPVTWPRTSSNASRSKATPTSAAAPNTTWPGPAPCRRGSSHDDPAGRQRQPDRNHQKARKSRRRVARRKLTSRKTAAPISFISAKLSYSRLPHDASGRSASRPGFFSPGNFHAQQRSVPASPDCLRRSGAGRPGRPVRFRRRRGPPGHPRLAPTGATAERTEPARPAATGRPDPGLAAGGRPIARPARTYPASSPAPAAAAGSANPPGANAGDPQEQAAYDGAIDLFRKGQYKEASESFAAFTALYPASQARSERPVLPGRQRYALKD